jgi:hypothetical protein
MTAVVKASSPSGIALNDSNRTKQRILEAKKFKI